MNSSMACDQLSAIQSELLVIHSKQAWKGMQHRGKVMAMGWALIHVWQLWVCAASVFMYSCNYIVHAAPYIFFFFIQEQNGEKCVVPMKHFYLLDPVATTRQHRVHWGRALQLMVASAVHFIEKSMMISKLEVSVCYIDIKNARIIPVSLLAICIMLSFRNSKYQGI